MGKVAQENKWIDPFMKKVLDFTIRDLNKDWDAWFVYAGREGVGKSTIAMQHAHYITGGKLSVDDICFTPEQFKERIQTQEKGGAVIYDEAVTGYLSATGLSKLTQMLTMLAAQCRKRNLFVCICIPSFYDLNKYIAIHRSDALVYVDAPPDSKGMRQRGTYFYFNKKAKQNLYVKNKKTYFMNTKSAAFVGSFTHWHSINMPAYEKKKDKALEELMPAKVKTPRDFRDAVVLNLHKSGVSQNKISVLTELARSTVNEIIAKNEKVDLPPLGSDFIKPMGKKPLTLLGET